MFRALVLSACLIGVAQGLVMTALQAVGVTPTLLATERSAAKRGRGHQLAEQLGAWCRPLSRLEAI